VRRHIVATLLAASGLVVLAPVRDEAAAVPPAGDWAICVGQGWESDCGIYVLYDEHGAAVNMVVGGPDLADGRWNCAALGTDGCAASRVGSVAPQYVSTTTSTTSSTTTSTTPSAPPGAPAPGSGPAPATTVAPEPVRCPTTLCGYAVIDDDGYVYGVIVCSDACTGQRMTQSYMGCPAGCRMVVQGQQTADGNVAGWHGQDVRYDERNQSFELPSGGSLRSGARLEDAVFPTTTVASTGDDGTTGGPEDVTGFMTEGGAAYATAGAFVAGESTVSMSADAVAIAVPALPYGELDYTVTFDPSEGDAESVVESGRIIDGTVVEAGTASAMAARPGRGAVRWTVTVDRARMSSTEGRLVLVLWRGSQRLAEVSATVAAPRRFAVCGALHRRYPAGVAMGAVRAERMPLTRVTRRFGRPLVDAGLYAMNRRLDVDRDGIACERGR